MARELTRVAYLGSVRRINASAYAQATTQGSNYQNPTTESTKQTQYQSEPPCGHLMPYSELPDELRSRTGHMSDKRETAEDGTVEGEKSRWRDEDKGQRRYRRSNDQSRPVQSESRQPKSRLSAHLDLSTLYSHTPSSVKSRKCVLFVSMVVRRASSVAQC